MDGRLEYKYLVPNAFLDRMRTDLQPFMTIDHFAEKSASCEYTVRSVYYDTPTMRCYDDKLDGIRMRKKFRIRGYNNPQTDSVVFLEIKKKDASFIDKHRAPLHYKHLPMLLATRDIDKYIIAPNGNTKARDDAARFLFSYYRYGLRPTVLVVYDREAFMGKFDSSLRLTFDKHLRRALSPSLEALYTNADLQCVLSRHFIFEIKFFRGALPAWVVSIVRRYALPRMALSKYTMCLDVHQAPTKSVHMRSRLMMQALASA